MTYQNTQMLSPQAFRCRSMLEAFRLGVVPRGRAEEFTFGRHVEIATMKRWLHADGIGTLFLRGAYGSGKSHLLEYLYSLALDEGFAVATVSLDPNEAPPSRPKPVFHALLRSFRYKNGDSVGDIRDFMRMFSRKAKSDCLSLTGWMGKAVQLSDTPSEQAFWQWMDGYGYLSDTPTLYDHGTAANIYSNIISGISWLACSVLKLGGLVVILDEAENVDNAFYTYQREKGFNFLRGLAFVAGDDVHLVNERVDRVWNRPGLGGWFGAETKLVYHGHSRLRYCYQSPSFLKVAFALTTEYGDFNLLGSSRISVSEISVDKLSDGALKELFSYICLLYGSAYDFQGAVTHIDDCFRRVVSVGLTGNRSFIKGSVEILDIRRFHPELSIAEIV